MYVHLQHGGYQRFLASLIALETSVRSVLAGLRHAQLDVAYPRHQPSVVITGPVSEPARRALALARLQRLVHLRFQQLIRTGPYRYIRHPSYLGGLLTVPGMMLALRRPLSIVVFVFSAVFVATRIGREEKMLIGQFPEEYAEYRRRSWRLLPYVF